MDMKQCRRCGELKSRKDGFYFRPNGHIISPCKSCCYAKWEEWRKANPEKRREQKRRARERENPGVHAARLKRVRAANPDKYKAINQRWSKANRERVAMSNRASRLVRQAVANGELTRPGTCEECGATHWRIEGAHSDYTKPLDVRWLCPSCHRKWDAEEPKTIKAVSDA
jgi:hypothetical protein